MSILLPLLPLIAQVGPFSAPKDTGLPIPRMKREKVVPAAAPPPATSPKGQECARAVEADADGGLDLANAWLARAKGAERAEARMCIGMAQSKAEDWEAAEQAFVAGRDEAGSDRLLRARLGAMAGNAALAAGAADRALPELETAALDVKGLSSLALESAIALDRARALVALKRDAEAEEPLADARIATPNSAEAWLLAATLARRQGHLPEAQARIEHAAALMPVDPEIGLEAGVIAMLSGHEDAARKSWDSVLAASPDSDAGRTAKGYLAQLAQVGSTSSVPPATVPPVRPQAKAATPGAAKSVRRPKS